MTRAIPDRRPNQKSHQGGFADSGPEGLLRASSVPAWPGRITPGILPCQLGPEGLIEHILCSTLRAHCASLRASKFAPGEFVEPLRFDPSRASHTKNGRNGRF
jgi:hypothetical protein